jgi:hypothetical protein
MGPHLRIRKTVKWGGAAVTVLFVMAWLASGWCYFTWNLARFPIGIGAGQLRVCDYGPGAFRRWHSVVTLSFHPWEMEWSPAWNRNNFPFDQYDTPLWIPALVCAAATVGLWRWEASDIARLNLCAKCGYDRTGLAAGAVCPECGRLPA